MHDPHDDTPSDIPAEITSPADIPPFSVPEHVADIGQPAVAEPEWFSEPAPVLPFPEIPEAAAAVDTPRESISPGGAIGVAAVTAAVGARHVAALRAELVAWF